MMDGEGFAFFRWHIVKFPNGVFAGGDPFTCDKTTICRFWWDIHDRN